MKPIIGVVARSETLNDSSIYYVNSKVVRSVVNCGGIPILLISPQNVDYEEKDPSKLERLTEENKKDIEETLKLCDGILMPGGFKTNNYDLDEGI